VALIQLVVLIFKPFFFISLSWLLEIHILVDLASCGRRKP
jgi:hypothetical protein